MNKVSRVTIDLEPGQDIYFSQRELKVLRKARDLIGNTPQRDISVDITSEGGYVSFFYKFTTRPPREQFREDLSALGLKESDLTEFREYNSGWSGKYGCVEVLCLGDPTF